MHYSFPLIEVRDVKKRYGRGTGSIAVLDGISLTINEGDFIAIVGPSGSGKTTLAHVIGGLVSPSQGSIRIDGEALKSQRDKVVSQYRLGKIGFVFQNFGLIPYYTAEENCSLPLVVSGMAPSERRNKAVLSLQMVGLEKRAGARADTLSGGERQRVAIARALIMGPQILIADEPTGSLDTKRGGEIMAILRKLHKNGMTIIMVTHDPVVAAQASRIVHILDGKIEKEAAGANS